MSTSSRKKAAKQAAHAADKKLREYNKKFATKSRNKEFKEYVPTEPYRRPTPEYKSLETKVCDTSRSEDRQYTGDLIIGIGTLHKSNLVPVMRGTTQAEEIARMRR